MSTSADRVDAGATSTPQAPISPRAARSDEGGMQKKQDNQRKKKNLNRQAYRAQKFPLEEHEDKNMLLKKRTHTNIGGGIGDGNSSAEDVDGSSIDEDELVELAEQVKTYEKTVNKLHEMKESLKQHVSLNMFCVMIIIFVSIIMQGIRRAPESIKEMNAKIYSPEQSFEAFCATLLVNGSQVIWTTISSNLVKD